MPAAPRRRPHARLAALALALIAPAGAASASGTLYRCEAADGGLTFSSQPVAGQACRLVAEGGRPVGAGGAAPAPAPAQRPAVAPAPSRPAAPASAPAPAGPAGQAPAAAAAPSAPAAVLVAPAGSEGAAAPASSGPRVVFRTAAPGEALPEVQAPAGARVMRGAVYTYERDGVTHYTNVRPAGGADAQMLFSYVESCFACSARPTVDFGTLRLNTEAYAAEVAAAAAEFGVEEAFVRAVIHAESAFNPRALSHKGAQGLMQLIPATAERFGVADPFEPAQNIRGGVQYLAWLLERFDGDHTLAAAGYNAGEGAVDRFGGVPPYEETQRYVERVGVLTQRYRGVLAGTPAPSG